MTYTAGTNMRVSARKQSVASEKQNMIRAHRDKRLTTDINRAYFEQLESAEYTPPRQHAAAFLVDSGGIAPGNTLRRDVLRQELDFIDSRTWLGQLTPLTTEPARMMAPFPILTPARMVQLAPI
jgi:hypothetical protein